MRRSVAGRWWRSSASLRARRAARPCGLGERGGPLDAPSVLAGQDADDAAGAGEDPERHADRRAPAVEPRRRARAGSRCGSPTGSTRRSRPRAHRLPGRAAHPARRRRPAARRSRRGPTAATPLELIEPTCGGEEAGATVTVDYGEESVEHPGRGRDPGRRAAGRRSAAPRRAIERIAALEWSPGIEVRGHGRRRGRAVPADRAPDRARRGPTRSTPSAGTPLFTSADGDFWTVGQGVDGDGTAT